MIIKSALPRSLTTTGALAIVFATHSEIELINRLLGWATSKIIGAQKSGRAFKGSVRETGYAKACAKCGGDEGSALLIGCAED